MNIQPSFAIRALMSAAWILSAGLALPPSTAAQTPSEQETARGQEEKKKKPEDDSVFRWKGYPSWHFGKGTHVDLRARVQLDVQQFDLAVDRTDAPESDLARRRVAFEGQIRGVLAFEVDAELESENPWRDVYANYEQFDAVQIQGGQFKLPFSMDANTGPTNLDFAYRSLAARVLAPGRDRGVMVHGLLVDRIVRYEVGLFDRDGRNARTKNPDRVSGDRTLAGRLLVQPFRSSKSSAADLQAGFAFTSSEVPPGVRSLQGVTTLDETFFDRDLWVAGGRRRTGFEVRWRPGPFSIKSEYIRVATERRGQSVEDADLSPLLATAWYVSGTWALTGERKASGLSKPRRPLLRGGFGAFEAAVRLENLTFTSSATDGVPSFSARADVIEPASDRAITIGGNWYLNQWVKIQFNAIREALTIPRRGEPTSSRSSWSYVTRFQFTM